MADEIKQASLIITSSKLASQLDNQIRELKKKYNSELEVIRETGDDEYLRLFDGVITEINSLLSAHDERFAKARLMRSKCIKCLDKKSELLSNLGNQYYHYVISSNLLINNSQKVMQKFSQFLSEKYGTNSDEYVCFKAYLLWLEYRDLCDYYVEE